MDALIPLDTGQLSRQNRFPLAYSENQLTPMRRPASGGSLVEERRHIIIRPSMSPKVEGDNTNDRSEMCYSCRIFGFPFPVFLIIVTELCERFNFYGMNGKLNYCSRERLKLSKKFSRIKINVYLFCAAILVLYFTMKPGTGLGLDDATATVWCCWIL